MMDDSAARTLFPATALEGVSLGGAEVAAGRGYVAPAEEAALVASARSGDQDAFGALVRMHQRQVDTRTLRMLRDTEEAGEATQDVFLAAWQGLRQFRGDARFTTWLYRIAYNHSLRLLDQRRRDAAAKAVLVAASAHEHTPAGALSAQHAPDADRHIRATAPADIANLPARILMILVLRPQPDPS